MYPVITRTYKLEDVDVVDVVRGESSLAQPVHDTFKC
jgi:hypothetical protein